MSLAKPFAVFLLTVGVMWAILFYVADFPLRQSLVLSFVISALWRGGLAASAKPTERFTPYWVSVQPNWNNIVLDYKSLGQVEWDSFAERWEENTSKEYDVVYRGLVYTVVQQSEDFGQTLIYWNDRHSFVSEINFEQDMKSLLPKDNNQDEFLRRSDFDFFLKAGDSGYHAGIRVRDSWWKKVKSSCPPPHSEHPDYPCGQVDLVLAVIPYREFDLYWERLRYSQTYYQKTVPKIVAVRDENRIKFKWENKTMKDDYSGIRWPEHITHRYCDVQHRKV